MKYIIFLFAALPLSCTTLQEPLSSENQSIVQAPVSAPQVSQAVTQNSIEENHYREIDLKIAQLYSKIDTLESAQLQQKQRMKLLEKGLLLGIIPDELKSEKASHSSEPQFSSIEKELDGIAKKNQKPPDTLSPEKNEQTIKNAGKSLDAKIYSEKLQIAQQHFNSSNFGKAIVSFTEIGAEFDSTLTQDNHHYWIALSWYYLKEYGLAEKGFKNVVELNGPNSWKPHAHFYLAKIDKIRGFNDRALAQFKKIIEQFPDLEIAEMAKMEIEREQEKL